MKSNCWSGQGVIGIDTVTE
uniref:Uncharacterized protein n=1 Tax=Arundo donax TaxID=35708 RepID=A0A0A8Z5H3_ARUDO